MLRILVVALALLAGASVWLSNANRSLRPPEVATVFATPRVLPAVRLTDHTGGSFTTTQLEGQFSLLFFGFTNCPDICPITLKVLADANAELVARGERPLNVVFVSVDPGRDTPMQIERYLENFDPAFLGVTGASEALQPLLKALGVFVETHAHAGETAYSVTHNSTVYLIGPQADLVAVFATPHRAPTIATDAVRIRERYLRDQPSPLGPA